MGNFLLLLGRVTYTKQTFKNWTGFWTFQTFLDIILNAVEILNIQ